MYCGPPGSSVHGILQARILEWVPISCSREFSCLRDRTHISCIGMYILYHWATQEAQIWAYIHLKNGISKYCFTSYFLHLPGNYGLLKMQYIHLGLDDIFLWCFPKVWSRQHLCKECQAYSSESGTTEEGSHKPHIQSTISALLRLPQQTADSKIITTTTSH